MCTLIRNSLLNYSLSCSHSFVCCIQSASSDRSNLRIQHCCGKINSYEWYTSLMETAVRNGCIAVRYLWSGFQMLILFFLQRAVRWASGASGGRAPGETKHVASSGVWRLAQGILWRNRQETRYHVLRLLSPGGAKCLCDTAGKVRRSILYVYTNL